MKYLPTCEEPEALRVHFTLEQDGDEVHLLDSDGYYIVGVRPKGDKLEVFTFDDVPPVYITHKNNSVKVACE